jgi:hypothetical protein
MTAAEVHSVGALGVAVTWWLSLIESCHSFFFGCVFSSLLRCLSVLVSFWLCISFVDIEAGLMKIHYLKNVPRGSLPGHILHSYGCFGPTRTSIPSMGSMWHPPQCNLSYAYGGQCVYTNKILWWFSPTDIGYWGSSTVVTNLVPHSMGYHNWIEMSITRGLIHNEEGKASMHSLFLKPTYLVSSYPSRKT